MNLAIIIIMSLVAFFGSIGLIVLLVYGFGWVAKQEEKKVVWWKVLTFVFWPPILLYYLYRVYKINA